MNLKQLKNFQLVAEELNYHRAAKRAHLSQPAMSHSIKSLETELAELLFDRSSRSVKLTPFGGGVLEHADKLLAEARNFETGVKNLQLGVGGHLSIGMATTVAQNFGGRALVHFSKVYPKLNFEISVYNSAHILDRLSDELDHFSICDAQTAAQREDLTTQIWGHQRGNFFCRPNHPILKHDRPTFNLAHSYGLVSLNVTPSIKRKLEIRLGIDGTTVPLLHIASDDLKMCKDISAATDYILIAELDNVQADLDAGNFTMLNLEFEFSRDLCIARKIGRVLPQSATSMIDYLMENQDQIIAS